MSKSSAALLHYNKNLNVAIALVMLGHFIPWLWMLVTVAMVGVVTAGIGFNALVDPAVHKDTSVWRTGLGHFLSGCVAVLVACIALRMMW